MENIFKVVGISFCVIIAYYGIMLFVIGNIFNSNIEYVKQNCTEETSGIVVDLVEKKQNDSDGHINSSYYPIIEYKVGEETVRKELPSVLYSSKYSINDRIDIFYNPDNVEEIVIVGDDSLESFSKGFMIVGIFIFAIFGGIIILFIRRCVKGKKSDDVEPIKTYE